MHKLTKPKLQSHFSTPHSYKSFFYNCFIVKSSSMPRAYIHKWTCASRSLFCECAQRDSAERVACFSFHPCYRAHRKRLSRDFKRTHRALSQCQGPAGTCTEREREQVSAKGVHSLLYLAGTCPHTPRNANAPIDDNTVFFDLRAPCQEQISMRASRG